MTKSYRFIYDISKPSSHDTNKKICLQHDQTIPNVSVIKPVNRGIKVTCLTSCRWLSPRFIYDISKPSSHDTDKKICLQHDQTIPNDSVIKPVNRGIKVAECLAGPHQRLSCLQISFGKEKTWILSRLQNTKLMWYKCYGREKVDN